MYAKVYRSDFYSKDVLALLRPDDYANRKLAFLYAKNKLYDDLIDFIEHTSSVEVFQDPNYVNLLEELTRTYPHEYKMPQIQKEKAIEAMKLLIVKGADLNQTTMNNPNSFENIVFEKDFPKEFVEFALTLRDPNKKYCIKGRKTHWTPLFGAIATKNKEAFEKLLKDGADVNYKDEDGLDAFYFAVFSGQIEIAKRVLESGFTLNLNPKTKRHPLAIAVLSSNIEMLEYLLSLGFDTKKELFDRKHLLEFALTSPNKDIGREQQPLFINLEMYRYLFESFKDELNTPSDIGYHNLLLSKSGTNAFEALKILLVMGVDVHQNNKGYSPLQFLNEDEYFEQKVQILLAQKININNQDKDGDTPLHQFVIYSITAQEDMETYKDKKTDIETEELDIANILSFVQASQKTEFLERKKSSLELYKKTIKLFIENGADITLKNKQNKTPYDLALHGKIKDKELLELLRI
jgi:ankyrin repeat protein